MEITLFILGILGFVIAYITYMKTIVNEPKENTSFLLAQYDFAEWATKDLIHELRKYAERNNSFNEPFMQGLTFQEGIAFLENAYNKLFADSHRDGIAKQSKGRLATENLAKTIEAHIKHVQEVRTHLKFYFLKDFTG